MIKDCLLFTLVLFSFQSVYPQTDNSSNKKKLDSLINTSTNQHLKYKIQESIESANLAIDLAGVLNDDYNKSHAYNLIGLNHEVIKNYKEAEQGFNKAIYFANKIENDTLLCWLHNNLANIYDEGSGDAEKSIKFYQRALFYAKKIKDTFEILTPILNIGWTHINHKDYDKAYPFLEEANEYIEIAGDTESKSQVNYLFGLYYENTGDFNKAGQHYADAVVFGKAANIHQELSDIYFAYSLLEEKKSNHQHAHQLLLKHIEANKKIITQEKITQAALAQAKYEVDEYKRDLTNAVNQQQLQSEVNQRRNRIMIITLITAGLLMILLYVSYRVMKSKKRLSELLKKQNIELFHAKKEAEHQARVKSQFISTVSHELRTPLYGVVGISSLLLDDADVSKKEHSMLRSLKFSGDYLLNLINDVLQISKLESEKIKLNKTSFNIWSLVENIKHSFEYLAEQKQNTIRLEIDKSIPSGLVGDSVRLSQILINLVGNAAKFTDNDTIWIRLKNLNKNTNTVTVGFAVEDHGIGIPKDRQDGIFESYEQVDDGKGNLTGTGLGLTVVKQLVNLFGSKIRLESEVGEGSVFSFDIDFEIDTNREISTEATFELDSKGKKKNVLIVEDNKINQMVTRKTLENVNLSCEIVDNGLDAIDFMQDKNRHFDLILMDMNLPKMNGIDATRAIRKFDTNTPIVFLTATELEDIQDDIYQAGINDYIIKPYDKQEFYRVLLRNINGCIA